MKGTRYGCPFFTRKGRRTMESQLLQAISSVGFPIIVAFYLLVKVQTSMDNFTSKLDELLLEIRRDRLKLA